MPTYTYEVTVSEQHWAEGCDYIGLNVENATQCCPVYRAMAEAGLPVAEVYPSCWVTSSGKTRPLPMAVQYAIGRFDDYRQKPHVGLPDPITFNVDLEV